MKQFSLEIDDEARAMAEAMLRLIPVDYKVRMNPVKLRLSCYFYYPAYEGRLADAVRGLASVYPDTQLWSQNAEGKASTTWWKESI